MFKYYGKIYSLFNSEGEREETSGILNGVCYIKEENSVVFGNHQKGDNEMKIVNKYCTLGRVKKIVNKIEQIYDKGIMKQDINMIVGMIQNDIITEEAWNISKEGTIDFKRLKLLIAKRSARIALDFIEGNEESVAFNQ